VAGKTETITVKVLIESGTESPDRTRGYVVSALKSSLRNIRDGAVVLAVYNEAGELLGTDTSGTPSPNLQDEIEAVFDVEDWSKNQGATS